MALTVEAVYENGILKPAWKRAQQRSTSKNVGVCHDPGLADKDEARRRGLTGRLSCLVSVAAGAAVSSGGAAAVYCTRPWSPSSGAAVMALTVEAVYENGVLKPVQPLPLKEHEKVRIIVYPHVSNLADLYGVMGFQGRAEEADYFAMDPELDYPPPPEEP
jgi:predicted DNA-binding antitoxin AbrB/MazE fold protein